MLKNLLNIALFLLLAGGLIAGWYYLDKQVSQKDPPDEKKLALAKTPKEAVGAVGGMGGLSVEPLKAMPALPPAKPEKPVEKPKPVEAPKAATPAEPHELTSLGGDDFFIKVLLNSKGAGVQQLVLTQFDEADRVGREVKEADGKPRHLHLIPGFHRPLPRKILELPEYYPLLPGPVTAATNAILTEPAYTIYHYPSEDDPARRPNDADRMNDDYPSPELGTRTWKKVRDDKVGDEQVVAFETELGAPYYLKLRKTFSLKKGDYHLGFNFEMEPLSGHVRGKGKFRYQIAGPRGLPVEGEWYTTTFRNVYIGWEEKKYPGKTSRDFEDAASINQMFGSVKHHKPEGKLTFAGVGTQYFAGVIALDTREPEVPAGGYWEYCRATREQWQTKLNELPQLDDVTVRAVTPVLEVDSKLAHHYVLYHGPIKVRQLGQMKHVKNGAAVDDSLVDWYADTLGLKTLTDYHSPNALGRFSSAIYWSDLLIASTNIMHGVLGLLHRVVPVWGIDIMLLTVLVRCLLLVPSRKQQMVAAKMSAKIQALQPEIDKLKEKYGDDFNTFNQEKTKLLLKNKAINPAAQMGGCLLIILQMPVFMGLYFCLQESVFFRLEPFLFGWIPNLAAPDMTLCWSESIPVISDPDYRTGILSFLYLGPFFNLLPILTVTLMAVNQKLTMPPPTDDMQKQQYKIMQWMMVLMGLFFYKVAAGLCVYFICSSVWSLLERKLIPKPKVTSPVPAAATADSNSPVAPADGGGLLARLRAKVEEMQKQAEAQSARQIRNAPADRRDRKKRK